MLEPDGIFIRGEAPKFEEEEDRGLPGDMRIADPREARRQSLQHVLAAAMTGELVKNRPLKYWENLRLKPVHMQMVMMKAAGYRNNEIAEQMNYDSSRVSVVLNHPDSQTLLSILISHAAEDVLDINARIKAHAGEALDTALYVMRTTTKDETRLNASFGLLKMAGYGAVEQKKVTHELKLDRKDSQHLAEVAREARELIIEQVDYSEFLEDTDEEAAGGGGAGESVVEDFEFEEESKPIVESKPTEANPKLLKPWN